MGQWGFYHRPTEPSYAPDWEDWDRIYEQESLDERAEQNECVEEDDEKDWGAWLEDGERPVPNTGP